MGLFKQCYLPQSVYMHIVSYTPSVCPISHEAAQNLASDVHVSAVQTLH